uniref:PR domain zinc finger protein 8 n=1 Tax=Zosterops lateralis melanops TaxID=1220523 RepID=A0A8D2PM66_ZOSLA
MELTSLPKFLWTSDNKLLHHHFPDILATVHTTQDIPKEVVFGPCMLQNTLLDTVAFIALKCSDRRNIHYVFKVDVTSVHSPTGLPWMRLVQAAANSKEQNLEAYLENSQLYYRPTRKISKNEELLVWYDEELSRLLGFNEIKAQSPQSGKYQTLRCQECDRVFKCEHSYLSHVRFLCVPEKSALLWKNLQNAKTEKSNLAEQTTNFHSLARDLEIKMAACKGDHHSEQCFPIYLRTVAQASRTVTKHHHHFLLFLLFLFLDSSSSHLHILWSGCPELVCQILPHAEARGEADVSHLTQPSPCQPIFEEIK